MELHFEYKRIEHPYKDIASSKDEKWAEISLKVLDPNDNIIKNIFDSQWDVLVLIKWFIEHKKSLLEDKCPVEKRGESISCSIENFYENLENLEESDNMIEQVYHYRIKHDLRFALRGTDIKSVVIGLQGNEYTISHCSEIENWVFQIDLENFYNYLEKLEFEE